MISCCLSGLQKEIQDGQKIRRCKGLSGETHFWDIYDTIGGLENKEGYSEGARAHMRSAGRVG